MGIKESEADSIVLHTLMEYDQMGYYKIENDIVDLTERGRGECHKPVHDWG